MIKNKRFILMGVSGTGKTTIGKLLSKELNIPFFDGDDFHSEANVAKMQSGTPLNDEDRYGWLLALNNLLSEQVEAGAIVACSALTQDYRSLLTKNLDPSPRFLYLKGTFDEVRSRLMQRKGHYMPIDLLGSQFETLEEPENAIAVSIMQTPEEIVQAFLNALS